MVIYFDYDAIFFINSFYIKYRVKERFFCVNGHTRGMCLAGCDSDDCQEISVPQDMETVEG